MPFGRSATFGSLIRETRPTREHYYNFIAIQAQNRLYASQALHQLGDGQIETLGKHFDSAETGFLLRSLYIMDECLGQATVDSKIRDTPIAPFPELSYSIAKPGTYISRNIPCHR